MVLIAQQLADLMPDATQLESDELEMKSSEHYAQGIYQNKLRYFTIEGKLALTAEELAIKEKQRANQLEAKLRELGINFDDL